MCLLLMVDIIKCYCGSQQMDAALIIESFYECDGQKERLWNTKLLLLQSLITAEFVTNTLLS